MAHCRRQSESAVKGNGVAPSITALGAGSAGSGERKTASSDNGTGESKTSSSGKKDSGGSAPSKVSWNSPALCAHSVVASGAVQSKSKDADLRPAYKEQKIEWKKGELIGKGSFGKVLCASLALLRHPCAMADARASLCAPARCSWA